MAEPRSLLRRADVLTAIALILLGLLMLWKGLGLNRGPASTRPAAAPPVTEVRALFPPEFLPDFPPALPKPHGAADV